MTYPNAAPVSGSTTCKADNTIESTRNRALLRGFSASPGRAS
jgi:hypothetical protein